MAIRFDINIGDKTTPEGMTDRALQILEDLKRGAEAAGLESLTVVAARGTGHKSHLDGTEWDLRGKNANGTPWTPAQRATVASYGRDGAGHADRFGLYSGMGLHVGYSHRGHDAHGNPKYFSPAVWGAGGKIGGDASRNFRNSADRAFLTAFNQGKPYSGGSGASPTRTASLRENVAGRGGNADLMTRGSSNSRAVEDWQKFLNTQGAGLKVDGKFGNNTAAATWAYQSRNGLKADEIVGPATRAQANRDTLMYTASQTGAGARTSAGTSTPAATAPPKGTPTADQVVAPVVAGAGKSRGFEASPVATGDALAAKLASERPAGTGQNAPGATQFLHGTGAGPTPAAAAAAAAAPAAAPAAGANRSMGQPAALPDEVIAGGSARGREQGPNTTPLPSPQEQLQSLRDQQAAEFRAAKEAEAAAAAPQPGEGQRTPSAASIDQLAASLGLGPADQQTAVPGSSSQGAAAGPPGGAGNYAERSIADIAAAQPTPDFSQYGPQRDSPQGVAATMGVNERVAQNERDFTQPLSTGATTPGPQTPDEIAAAALAEQNRQAGAGAAGQASVGGSAPEVKTRDVDLNLRSTPEPQQTSRAPTRDPDALLAGIAAMGGTAANLPGILAGMPGSIQLDPDAEQRKAEAQRDQMYRSMDFGDLLNQGSPTATLAAQQEPQRSGISSRLGDMLGMLNISDPLQAIQALGAAGAPGGTAQNNFANPIIGQQTAAMDSVLNSFNQARDAVSTSDLISSFGPGAGQNLDLSGGTGLDQYTAGGGGGDAFTSGGSDYLGGSGGNDFIGDNGMSSIADLFTGGSGDGSPSLSPTDVINGDFGGGGYETDSRGGGGGGGSDIIGDAPSVGDLGGGGDGDVITGNESDDNLGGASTAQDDLAGGNAAPAESQQASGDNTPNVNATMESILESLGLA